MKALKTGLRNLTLLAALGVAVPALLPQEVAARPSTCFNFKLPGTPYYCSYCGRCFFCGDLNGDYTWSGCG